MLEIKDEGIILEKTDLPFENKGVFNPACIKVNGITHMFYRAINKQKISSIGYCQILNNKVIKRLDRPILSPWYNYEKRGTEDPRIVFLDGLYYLFYTAFDGQNALVAYAVSKDLINFFKKGLVSPKITYDEAEDIFRGSGVEKKYILFEQIYKKRRGHNVLLWEKDACLFPKKIRGKFALMHRVLPGIQIMYFDDFSELTNEYWRKYLKELKQFVIIDPKYKFENRNVGGGCPPIETEEGWLLIYHAVEDFQRKRTYHTGAALVDLNDPTKGLGKSWHHQKRGFPNGGSFRKRNTLYLLRGGRYLHRRKIHKIKRSFGGTNERGRKLKVLMKKDLEQILTQKAKSIRVIYVSSYIPRHCGIATYTKDLTNAINLLNPYTLAEIMAVNRLEDVPDYPWEVKFKINQDDLSTYLQAADYINQSGADLVSLQHEFGLFGGHCGEYIVSFIEHLKRPLVTTLHTVVSDPKSDYGIIIKRLIKKSKGVIVMMKEIKEKLVIDYGAQPKKIVVVPHGAPDLPYGPTEKFKKKRKLAGKIVLGNINLLSKTKGIEYALKAVAIISQKYPDVLYLVIGQTHPIVLQNEGEKYRNFLKQKVKKLGISGNVKFVNEYLSLDELLDWLRTIDIYITPYLNPQQSASGALAYAIGAGKPCISTPYLYAKEVLSDRKGILVPFRDSDSIAQAVIYLWENPEKRKEIEKKAYSYGRLMTWPNVALQHLNLFGALSNRNEK